MTIDQDDCAPRPADDFIAHIDTPEPSLPKRRRWLALPRLELADMPRYFGMLKLKPTRCHQLGCEFSELPHG